MPWHELRGVDDLVLVAHEHHGLRHRVEFDHAGSRHVVELEAGELAAQLLTCKSISPHPIRSECFMPCCCWEWARSIRRWVR